MPDTMSVECEHCDLCWPGIWGRADRRARAVVRAAHPEWFEDGSRPWYEQYDLDDRRNIAINVVRIREIEQVPKPMVVLISLDGDDRWIHLCAAHLMQAIRCLEGDPRVSESEIDGLPSRIRCLDTQGC